MDRTGIDIAVVGMDAMFAGDGDKDGFWTDIVTRADRITEVPAGHWDVADYFDPDPLAPDKTYSKRGSFLSEIDFSPLDFAIPPRNLPATDTAQLLALVAARRLFDDLARRLEPAERERTSIILGVAGGSELTATMAGRTQQPVWLRALRDAGVDEQTVQQVSGTVLDSYEPWSPATFPGMLPNVVAGRIANRFDLGGTNCTVDAACASSLGALWTGVMELAAGRSDLVITGGVDVVNHYLLYLCFSKTPALSPTGDCRPFDADADGTMLGEGIGLFALKRLADAERGGDHIYAVLKGIGASSDGRAPGIYTPVARGQARAIGDAYRDAGYAPSTVELVEAHGTGTRAGDAAEIEGLRIGFDLDRAAGAEPTCAVGSIKSQIGHTKAAAGAAGLFKAAMALHHKVLPPTIKVDRPNPAVAGPDSPFYVNTVARPWIRDDRHPRRAAVSAFGFGGTNYHLTLEEYTGPARRPGRVRTLPSELHLLSAPDLPALRDRCRDLAGRVADRAAWRRTARDSQATFSAADEWRLAVVSGDGADLSGKLRTVDQGLATGPAEISGTGIYLGRGPVTGGLAFVFPGQGSQYVGMGADLAMAFDPARQVWDRSAGLDLGAGRPLHSVVFPAPAFDEEERRRQQQRLTATAWAQPAIGVTSLAAHAVLTACGLRPDSVAGHSFGELTALTAAGVFTPDDLVLLARRRGELMGLSTTRPGAMAAVLANGETVERIIAPAGPDVVVANLNAPAQTVISGAAEAVSVAETLLRAAGLAAQRLPVATGFHSPLMRPAVDEFDKYLRDVPMTAAAVPAMANVTGAAHPADVDGIRSLLAAQIRQPVLFQQQIQTMYDAGIRTFVEVGPGAVLTGLIGKCLAGSDARAISVDDRHADGVTALWRALGRLAAAGHPMDLDALWDGYAAPASADASRAGSDGERAPVRPKGPTVKLAGPNYRSRKPHDALAVVVPLSEHRGRSVTGHPNQHRSEHMSVATIHDAPAVPAPSDQLLSVLAQVHRAVAQAQSAHEQALVSAHEAFLRTTEAIVAGLGTAAGEPSARTLEIDGDQVQATAQVIGLQLAAAAGAAPVVAEPPARRSVVMPVSVPPPDLPVGRRVPSPAVTHAAPAAAAPVVADVPAPVVAAVPSPAPVVAAVPPPAPVATAAPVAGAPVVAATRAGTTPGGRRLADVLIDAVVEKTGYPKEMLDLSMELEASLGIDSIKRVEIMSSLMGELPAGIEVDPAEIIALRTLGEIVEHLEGLAGKA